MIAGQYDIRHFKQSLTLVVLKICVVDVSHASTHLHGEGVGNLSIYSGSNALCDVYT